jgi:hypothetical protein
MLWLLFLAGTACLGVAGGLYFAALEELRKQPPHDFS